tara:strand:- start:157 stop:642 length:486 start_codon:yes stop_codon:yes gene_type:complete
MSSILKVDTIQNTAGAAPFITSLGMKAKYFNCNVSGNYTSGGTRTYTLSNFAGDGASVSSNTITITEAGVYLLQKCYSCTSTTDANARWQENYIYINDSKVLDIRQFVINVDSNYEYYNINGSIIKSLSVGDEIELRGNGQNNWTINAGTLGSNFFGVRLQ